MSPSSAPSSAFLAGRIFLPFALGYYLSYLLRTVNAVISPDLTGELGLSAADFAAKADRERLAKQLKDAAAKR